MTFPETPRQLGYRWPAEWEPHRATWLVWPRNPDTWPGGLDAARRQFAHFATTVARFEPVQLLVEPGAVWESAEQILGNHPQIQWHAIATNDSWIRDHGPTFLGSDHSLPNALVDWGYNAWGNKYPPFDLDNAVPQRIATITGRRRFVADMVLEGGSVDGNGEGILLTTESCLLHPGRNPHLDRATIEQRLRDLLCVQQIIWLTGEIPGDDTDGHIDQIARFINPTTVVAVEDPDGRMFAENHTRLTARDGHPPLEVLPLPWPSPKYHGDQRLPTSYANFYIVNGGVIVPTFEDPCDQAACELLAHCFPDREIVPLPATALALGLGAFHCLSQQEPR